VEVVPNDIFLSSSEGDSGNREELFVETKKNKNVENVLDNQKAINTSENNWF